MTVSLNSIHLRQISVNYALNRQVSSHFLVASGIEVSNSKSDSWLDGFRSQGVGSLALCCGSARPSYVPPREFFDRRQQCRYRRNVVLDRARIRNRLQKTLDHDGLRLGGVLSDLLGLNGGRTIDGLVQRHRVERILKELTLHMRDKVELIAGTL